MLPLRAFKPFPVSRHFVAHHLTTSSFYAIISDSGKAMFIDYGSASGAHFGNFERATAATDRIRFVEHNIDELKRSYGLKSVDVVMPSHMHDDHLNGFPHLMRRYGTSIWCYENMLDILENPRGHNLGCILLAMKTKEISITLPVVILLYECSFFGFPDRKLLLKLSMNILLAA